MSQIAVERLVMPSTYINYLARAFDDHARLTAGTPLPPECLDDLDEPVPIRHVLQMVRNALAMAPHPDWHLPWAKGMAEHYHGPVTMALLSAPTLGAGLEVLVRYMPKRIPYYQWQGTLTDDYYYCELIELVEFGIERMIMLESPILCMHEYVRTIRAGRVEGAHVELRYPPTRYAASYSRYFDCPVRFEAPRNAMVVPRSWLATPNAGHDDATWRTALRRCAQTSTPSREQDTLLKVRRAVQAYIEDEKGGGAPPPLKTLAERLHLSPRTLVRRLRNANATYQSTLDDIQLARAQQLLASREWVIAAIANELGFHDAASFGRAFKRWSGMTPGAYRASLGIPRG